MQKIFDYQAIHFRFYNFRSGFAITDFPDIPGEQWAKLLTDESGTQVDLGYHILPMWLQDRRDMIFPHRSVEMKDMLGSGQYGTVNKGTFHLGNAM